MQTNFVTRDKYGMYAKGHWPAMADKSWSGVLHKFYGTTDAGL
jgi:hypothetical protein